MKWGLEWGAVRQDRTAQEVGRMDDGRADQEFCGDVSICGKAQSQTRMQVYAAGKGLGLGRDTPGRKNSKYKGGGAREQRRPLASDPLAKCQ